MAYNMSGNSFGTSTQQFNGGPNNSSFLNGSTSFLQEASTSSWQADELDRMSTLLSKKLGPEFLSQRVGGGGAKLTYIEGWRVINIANEVFGFSGWSSEIKHLDIDFIDANPETQRFTVSCSAIVRVTVRNGAFHEDVGFGKCENAKSKADALDKCKKEAVTDALKRALRSFGNLLGNCLYDKSFVSEIAKVKSDKPKLDPAQLHRPAATNTPTESVTKPATVTTKPVTAPVNTSNPSNSTRQPMSDRPEAFNSNPSTSTHQPNNPRPNLVAPSQPTHRLGPSGPSAGVAGRSVMNTDAQMVDGFLGSDDAVFADINLDARQYSNPGPPVRPGGPQQPGNRSQVPPSGREETRNPGAHLPPRNVQANANAAGHRSTNSVMAGNEAGRSDNASSGPSETTGPLEQQGHSYGQRLGSFDGPMNPPAGRVVGRAHTMFSTTRPDPQRSLPNLSLKAAEPFPPRNMPGLQSEDTRSLKRSFEAPTSHSVRPPLTDVSPTNEGTEGAMKRTRMIQ